MKETSTAEELSEIAILTHAVLSSAVTSETPLEQLWTWFNSFEYVGEALTAKLNELEDSLASEECDEVIAQILEEAEAKTVTEGIKTHVIEKVKDELKAMPLLNAIGENDATMITARDTILRVEAIIKQATALSEKYLPLQMRQNLIFNKAFPSLVEAIARLMMDSADDLSINSADVVAKLIKRIQEAFPQELPCLKKLSMLQQYYRFGLGEIVDDLTERATVHS